MYITHTIHLNYIYPNSCEQCMTMKTKLKETLGNMYIVMFQISSRHTRVSFMTGFLELFCDVTRGLPVLHMQWSESQGRQGVDRSLEIPPPMKRFTVKIWPPTLSYIRQIQFPCFWHLAFTQLVSFFLLQLKFCTCTCFIQFCLFYKVKKL